MILENILLMIISSFFSLIFIVGVPAACFNYVKEEVIGNSYKPALERIGEISFFVGLSLASASLGGFILIYFYKLLFI